MERQFTNQIIGSSDQYVSPISNGGGKNAFTFEDNLDVDDELDQAIENGQSMAGRSDNVSKKSSLKKKPTKNSQQSDDKMSIDFVQKAAIEICSKAINSAYKPYVMEIKVLEIEDLISQAVTKAPQTICKHTRDAHFNTIGEDYLLVSMNRNA